MLLYPSKEKGCTLGKEGEFYIDCSKTKRIAISFVGYEAAQYTIKNCKDVFTVALTPYSQSLTNVEIAATASQNKALINQPAAITQLNSVEIKRGTGLFLKMMLSTQMCQV